MAPVNMFCFGLVALCLLNTYVNGAVDVIEDVKGVYWRDYVFGVVPIDAVFGSEDFMVGQILHIAPVNGKLIPAGVDPSAKNVSYYWNKSVYHVNKNVKILCSVHQELISWMPVNNIKELQQMDHSSFVLGGYDSRYPLYIGRVIRNGEMLVGKITLDRRYQGMQFVYNEKAYAVQNDFMILTYLPESIHATDEVVVVSH